MLRHQITDTPPDQSMKVFLNCTHPGTRTTPTSFAASSGHCSPDELIHLCSGHAKLAAGLGEESLYLLWILLGYASLMNKALYVNVDCNGVQADQQLQETDSF